MKKIIAGIMFNKIIESVAPKTRQKYVRYAIIISVIMPRIAKIILTVLFMIYVCPTPKISGGRQPVR